jgi:hypothetical protein
MTIHPGCAILIDMEQTRQASSWRTLARAWRIAWPIIRQVIGWIFIILGIIGLVLPILQGVLFLVIGIALVGRRNWLIRKTSVSCKLFLRRWAAVQTPLIGPLGRVALRGQQRVSWQRRRLHWWYEERRRQRALQRAEHVSDDSP